MTAVLPDATVRVHRPVQYLGSKLRVLPELVGAVGAGGESQTVWDPFTGSTVVAQALGGAGHRVVAADALLASATLAEAMLGVARGVGDLDDAQVDRIVALSCKIPVPSRWKSWIDRERSALASGDGAELLALGATMPQAWRPNWEPDTSGIGLALLSDVYAGTYFGIAQALRLERLRLAVDLAYDGGLGRWERAAALTALCNAASQAVFSAGKHFAQPHKITSAKSLGFHARRALTDRSIDVDTAFRAAAAAVRGAARPSSEGHSSHHGRVEDTPASALQSWGVTTVYADPPYTAQQYSRFYHLLDTLVSGSLGPLQRVGGRVTSGLYPEGRYLSPFCSRRRAPEAFERLAVLAADASARLIVSYSGPGIPGGATGNARSVTMRQLVECLSNAYPRVTVSQLPVAYRQFNRQESEVPGRRETEYLVIGVPVAR